MTGVNMTSLRSSELVMHGDKCLPDVLSDLESEINSGHAYADAEVEKLQSNLTELINDLPLSAFRTQKLVWGGQLLRIPVPMSSLISRGAARASERVLFLHKCWKARDHPVARSTSVLDQNVASQRCARIASIERRQSRVFIWNNPGFSRMLQDACNGPTLKTGISGLQGLLAAKYSGPLQDLALAQEAATFGRRGDAVPLTLTDTVYAQHKRFLVGIGDDD